MNQSNTRKICNKLVSGRLWLTAICGISFLCFAVTICQILYVKRDLFNGAELVSIINVILLVISNVMTFYFTKSREDMVSEKKDNAAFINKEPVEKQIEETPTNTEVKAE